MIDPTQSDTADFDAAAYVAAVAPAVGLRLDADRAHAVALALQLVARIGRPALAVSLPGDIQPAPIFTP